VKGNESFITECINIHRLQVSIQVAFFFPLRSAPFFLKVTTYLPHSSSYDKAVPNAATNGLGPYEDDDKECHGNSVHSIMQQAFLLLVLVIVQAIQLYSAFAIQLRLYGHTI